MTELHTAISKTRILCKLNRRLTSAQNWVGSSEIIKKKRNTTLLSTVETLNTWCPKDIVAATEKPPNMVAKRITKLHKSGETTFNVFDINPSRG